ncbi:MAG TPA: addiction module protein [Chloroflexia bacterium]|nr:addiction module protein [Chloroflexia bacterium]
MTTQMLEEILQLSVPERLRLVEEIWDTISDTPEELPLSEAQREEIERRLEAYEQRPEEGRPWREVLDRIRASNG